ncbi:bacitracin transport system ATP-binding protein [Seinonella peptonophila]|uniref:Bacitracin transport system ATP-binding protein n=1 Tax=Seinonella peptonophila TaxID=112248 RepID=A0A1M4YD98_9BACL|nr:ATP-binding cassette domain-containing protein [Seinonella peptonophila]SHF03689.1 bacitracin transport system ATP-binding protein [Seinonella peptonophila]
MENWVLKTSNLTRQFGTKKVVDSIDIHVPKGQIYGLLGRNGAGKSTTLRMIMGMVRPTSGKVYLFGQECKRMAKELYLRVGSLIETPGFYHNLTGNENLNILARLRGVHRSDAVAYALSKVGLDQEPKKVFSEYSLGMKQRLGIAAAILHEPELLILDEPINGLDPIGIQEMRKFLLELCKEKQVTILISSHILSEIELLVDRVGLIHKGKLLDEVALDELRKRNRRYLVFQVSNMKKAALVIEKHFYTTDYEILEQGEIRLFSKIEQAEALNRVLVKNGVDVSRITMNEETLEDYFVKQIGGGVIG